MAITEDCNVNVFKWCNKSIKKNTEGAEAKKNPATSATARLIPTAQLDHQTSNPSRTLEMLMLNMQQIIISPVHQRGVWAATPKLSC